MNHIYNNKTISTKILECIVDDDENISYISVLLIAMFCNMSSNMQNVLTNISLTNKKSVYLQELIYRNFILPLNCGDIINNKNLKEIRNYSFYMGIDDCDITKKMCIKQYLSFLLTKFEAINTIFLKNEEETTIKNLLLNRSFNNESFIAIFMENNGKVDINICVNMNNNYYMITSLICKKDDLYCAYIRNGEQWYMYNNQLQYLQSVNIKEDIHMEKIKHNCEVVFYDKI